MLEEFGWRAYFRTDWICFPPPDYAATQAAFQTRSFYSDEGGRTNSRKFILLIGYLPSHTGKSVRLGSLLEGITALTASI